MAEYIEREALENELYRRLKFLIAEYGEHDQYTSGFDDAIDMVRSFTSADVAPVRHGKWVKEPPYKSIGGEYLKALICSKCNSFFVSDGNKPWQMHNYCPNCGAKMDGEEQDDE